MGDGALTLQTLPRTRCLHTQSLPSRPCHRTGVVWGRVYLGCGKGSWDWSRGRDREGEGERDRDRDRERKWVEEGEMAEEVLREKSQRESAI